MKLRRMFDLDKSGYQDKAVIADNKTTFSGKQAVSGAAFMLLGVMVWLAGCQTAPQTRPNQPSVPVISASVQQVPSRPKPASQSTENQQDIVGNLIDQIEQDAGRSLLSESEQLTSQDQALLAPLASGDAVTIDDERASKRLDAALDLLKQKTKPLIKPNSDYQLAEKQAGQLRVGMFVPLSGEYSLLGQAIANGAELALFQTNSSEIEIIYFDTGNLESLDEIAASALSADIDVTIGPLFSYPLSKIAPVMAAYNIPVLSLSNNMAAAQTGSWVLGYLPEQQLDNLLAHVIEQDKSRIAILASEDSFGQTLLSHAQARLADFGLSPAQITLLSDPLLADEPTLKDAIKQFSGYQPPAEDSTELPPPLYDSVLLAGNPEFILRTAPVLDYYDLGPSRVTFLGTDLWGRAELMSEPSLQGAIITQALLPEKERFDSIWRDYFAQNPSILSRLGFDVMAVIAITKSQNTSSEEIDWTRSLLRDKGFSGFSGSFTLLPDGRNNRAYKLYRIEGGKLTDL